MKEAPETIITRFEERRRKTRVRRVQLIAYAAADLILSALAGGSVVYFFSGHALFPILLSAVFGLVPLWIGHRWARWFPSQAPKKDA